MDSMDICIMNPWQWIKEYFNLSQRERNGITMVIILISLVIATQYTLHYFAKPPSLSPKAFDSAMALLKNGKGLHDENIYFNEIESGAAEAGAKPANSLALKHFSVNKITVNGLLFLGFSPYIAKHLVEYRDMLGGYANAGQMKEVYGMDSATLKIINSYAKIDPDEIRKIDINHVLTADLARHPYFRYHHLANAIVEYREQHGDYKNITDLKNILTIDAETYLKIAPYIIIK